jgi:DNA repair exonuclease SbcCD ATPase subunit
MKYQKFCLSFLPAIFLSAAVMTGLAAAQQPAKVKRPVKNPPQFPSIIDLENKEARQTDRQAEQQDNAPVPDAGGQHDSLAVAVQSLANELRVLGQELRSLNIRGQAQIEMLRMTRADMRIDSCERELKPVRERLAAIDADEQLLRQMMTREGLLAQTANTPTLNREESMRQLRIQLEARYRAVQSEQERLRKLEADLTASLKIYQNISRETEQKIQEAEDALKNIESGRRQ